MTAVHSVAEITRLTRDIFEAVGVGTEDARTAAHHLVLADARGVMTHGLMRLPLYVDRIRRGDCAVDRAPEVVSDRGAVLVVDGHHHLGQVTADFAMRRAVARAGEMGVGVASVRRGAHFGTAGSYVLLAAERDVIGVAMTNTARLMAPTGGTARRIGNNPVAIGVPFRGHAPIVLDIAFSAVAAGAIRLAADRGQPIPESWGLDREGRPTTDAYEVFQGGGLLRPIGDHKGYGMALMVDILSGVLSGGGFGDAIVPLDQQGPFNGSHLLLALDISHFIDPTVFAERLTELTGQVRDTPLAPGVDRILLPGQREAETQQARSRTGIPYPDDIFEPVARLAAHLGVVLPEPLPEDFG